MTIWQGRARVQQQRRELLAAFERADAISPNEYLVRADMARILCIMVCGWLEMSAFELAAERCRRDVSGPALAFALSQLEWSKNPTTDVLANLLGRFDLAWREAFEASLDVERKTAINSIVGLRNDVAHGRWSGTSSLSLARVRQYFDTIDKVVNELSDVLDPL